MNRLLIVLTVALLGAPVLSLLLGRERRGPSDPVRTPAPVAAPGVDGAPGARAAAPAPAVFRAPGEDERYREAARTARAYVESQYHPSTGLVNSVLGYRYATVWDIASTLAAYHSAHALGLIPAADFDRRMARALRTLSELRLFQNAVFNKNYRVDTGAIAGRDDREQEVNPGGFGWSAMDLGRLLVWLKIVESAHPQHAPAVREVVGRLDLGRVVRDGYLWGETLGSRGGLRRYQEGRIGYEQYAAAGLALWGYHAERALRMEENAEPVEVHGVTLFTDRRGNARLTSEPFILIGLELGWWSPVWEEMAEQVLAAQRARFEQTGQLTAVSEDALPVPPHFFYYYTVHGHGRPFAVATVSSSEPLAGPRWISTKAAFAWHALLPEPYTWKLVESVAARADHPGRGWSSGVYERTGAPTGSQNVNTAAVVLEAAVYQARRRPLLEGRGEEPVGGMQGSAAGVPPRRDGG